ncbi:alpha/beta fold hydrolase [Parasporobacterium paucivorans]|uniref:Pimeloyl-ACP methyl ester carboxylesterase n=1 Tax=Parasporobacterium paucivorans DSM 15970 TaxID=1122934 RepID=A0A1M6LBZ3_9FIRM|nr:alpha/beta hydrolase [Parasporobacterium paucivorans]SHJ68689.1 Pimeloyl-ACP methyl ester carboxylesterase [Parasporobacterium paucivorans DSM 15970]
MIDIKLHYIEKGEGKPLVLLHGNGEESGCFINQINYFSRDYRVIAVDTRGHGRSPRGSKPFTLGQFVEDLKNFLDDLGLTRINLLGFSDGGNVAMLFALKYPEYLEKLVLNGANSCPWGVRARYQIPVVLSYCIEAIRSLVDKKAVSKKELVGLMVKEPRIKRKELFKLKVPTLVIAGDRDMVGHRHTVKLAKSLPGGRLSILKGDHFIVYKEWEAFNREVGKFLQS